MTKTTKLPKAGILNINTEVIPHNRAVTYRDVMRCYDALQRRYGSKVIEARKSFIVKLIGAFLHIFGFNTYERFTKNFSITIGRRIYLNMEFDNPEALPEDNKRLLYLLIHEHQHVAQWDRLGISFWFKYLLSKEFRVDMEAEAYATHNQLSRFMGWNDWLTKERFSRKMKLSYDVPVVLTKNGAERFEELSISDTPIEAMGVYLTYLARKCGKS